MATESQTKTLALVDDFRTHTVGMWPNLDRATVADGLATRINDSTNVSSSASNLCWPASFVYEIAKSDPEAYANAAISLYETGVGNNQVIDN